MQGANYTIFDAAGVLPIGMTTGQGVAVYRSLREDIAKNPAYRKVLIGVTDSPDDLRAARRMERLAARRIFAILVVPAEGSDTADFVAALGRVRAAGVRNAVFVPDRSAFQRLAAALRHGREWARDNIAWAVLADQGRTLAVVNCLLEQEDFIVAEIPSLLRMDVERRKRFTMDDSWLHWPEPDIHLDLPALREATQSELRQEAVANADEYWARYGAAMRSLHEAVGLTQAEIQERAGVTSRQIRRIENGESRPRVDTLNKLAVAHGMEVSEYLTTLAELAAS